MRFLVSTLAGSLEQQFFIRVAFLKVVSFILSIYTTMVAILVDKESVEKLAVGQHPKWRLARTSRRGTFSYKISLVFFVVSPSNLAE